MTLVEQTTQENRVFIIIFCLFFKYDVCDDAGKLMGSI